MAKPVTLKDVLYALEYTDAQLCRWPSLGNHKPSWSLEPGGAKVPPHVAEQACLSPSVTASEGARYGEARYSWRRAA